MVRVKMGWLGILALLPCAMAFSGARDLGSDCEYIMQCETALFGFNDKTIRGITADACKEACLEEVDFDCLSVDYVRDSESCYLSTENAVTQAPHMGTHSGSDHYSYLCGAELETSAVEEVAGTGCGFTKQCHMALFGFNTKTIEGMSLDGCKTACIEESEFECLSFDYSSDSESCYLSEEDSDTQGPHIGPHFGADFYQKVCFGGGGGSGSGYGENETR